MVGIFIGAVAGVAMGAVMDELMVGAADIVAAGLALADGIVVGMLDAAAAATTGATAAGDIDDDCGAVGVVGVVFGMPSGGSCGFGNDDRSAGDSATVGVLPPP